ncbi:amino acid permease [Duganella sp. FT80W]|uniref:Amino acid permease n=1 Tax=Duganella guangzhouensis TaxID=2666084 RepID=A0A6I2KTB1_9BURK|nr:APC family permease [Duganella guangzhouensis]MRW88510.1 amino acid permease [Duganella guangzhouensis]
MTQTPLPMLDGTIIAAPHVDRKLAGDMGTLQLVFAVLSYNAPLGVLATVVALVIGYGIGLGAPLLFIVLGLLMALFAVGYTAMSRHLPNPGAFYSYITAGLGRPLGLGGSFVAMLSYTLAMISMLIFASLALASLVQDTLHGPAVAWWVWALAFIAIVGVLGYRRVDVSARVLGILLGLEVLIVLAWEVCVFAAGGDGGSLTYSSFDPQVALGGGVAVGMIFAISCFGGFEATAIFRDEVRDPVRTVPRATYLAIGFLTVFYAAGSWALIQALGESKAVGAIAEHPTTAFFDMVSRYLGATGYHLVTVLIISSAFAGLMAYHNVLSRYLFSLGVDGILPQAVGVAHPRLKSPHRASLSLSIATAVYVLGVVLTQASPTEVYIQLIGVAGYSFIILFVLAAIGIAAYLARTEVAGLSVWQRYAAPGAAAVLMTVIGIIATSKIDLLTNSPSLSAISLDVTYGAVLAGIVLALLFRTFRPEVFARIGRQ